MCRHDQTHEQTTDGQTDGQADRLIPINIPPSYLYRGGGRWGVNNTWQTIYQDNYKNAQNFTLVLLHNYNPAQLAYFFSLFIYIKFSSCCILSLLSRVLNKHNPQSFTKIANSKMVGQSPHTHTQKKNSKPENTNFHCNSELLWLEIVPWSQNWHEQVKLHKGCHYTKFANSP